MRIRRRTTSNSVAFRGDDYLCQSIMYLLVFLLSIYSRHIQRGGKNNVPLDARGSVVHELPELGVSANAGDVW